MAGRYREESSVRNAPRWEWWSYGNPSSPSITGTNIVVGTKSQMWDVLTPHFRSLSAEGKVIMNPMTRCTVTRSAKTMSLYGHYADGNPTHWGQRRNESDYAADLQVGASLDLAPGYSTELHSVEEAERVGVEASTRCISKRNRASTDSWENLAEMRKTLEMLRHPLDSFFKFERKWRRSKSNLDWYELRSEKLRLTPQDAWLMYRYGIRPLAKSVADVLEALGKRTKPRYTTTRGEAVSSKSTGTTVTFNQNSYLVSVYGIQKTETVKYRAVSVDAWERDMLWDFGLSRKELFGLPWALVPASFVADWFVNISEFIGAMADATLLRASLGECLTREVIKSEVRTSSSSYHVGTSLVQTSQALSQVRTDTVLKQRVPYLAIPGLVIKANFGLSEATRLADAFALVAQRVSILGGILSLERKVRK